MKKACTLCNAEKSIDGFSKTYNKNDGRRNVCKSCENIRKKKHRQSVKGEATYRRWTLLDKKNHPDKWLKRRDKDQAEYREQLKIATLKPYRPFGIVQMFYPLCREKTQETGIRYSVDHIIPLKNNKVCGLNVPWNIQVIPLADNILKGNKLEVPN